MFKINLHYGNWSSASLKRIPDYGYNNPLVMQTSKGVEDLPEEIIVEILSRVEARDIFNLKSLSKGFLSLLSSKSFMLDHMQKMIMLNRSIFIFQNEFCFTPLFYLRKGVHNMLNGKLTTVEEKSIELLAAVGSLILICDNIDNFHLLNPITMEKKKGLPICKINYPEGSTWAEVFFEMGYLKEIDDYNIVRVALFNTTEFKAEVMAYSRNIGSWNRGADFPSDYPMCQPGVFVHGRLHWRSSIFYNKYSITAYDLIDGSYYSFNMPKVPLLYGSQQILSLDDETLAVSCSMSKEGSPHTIWILKNYNDKNSWIKVSIQLEGTMYDSFLVSLQLLCLISPERTQILFRVDPIGCFGIFDMDTNVYKEVSSEEIVDGFTTPYRFTPSIHSLFPNTL